MRLLIAHTPVLARLTPGKGAHRGIACWTKGQWLRVVSAAYGRYYLPLLRDRLYGGVSKTSVLAVAAAMAGFADADTGRGCRPSVATLMKITGASRRTVQRARRALELLGLARIVVDGRVRTRAERITSWEMGDRGRGWATEYALSIPATVADLQVVDDGTPSRRALRSRKSGGKTLSTGKTRAVKSGSSPDNGTTSGRSSTYGAALRLAHGWASCPTAPSFVVTDPTALAPALTEAVEAGWNIDDLTEAVNRHQSQSGMIANPHSPGGWLRWLIRQYTTAETPQRPTQARQSRVEAAQQARAAYIAERAAQRAYDDAHRTSAETRAAARAEMSEKIAAARRQRVYEAESPAIHRRQSPRTAGGWRTIAARHGSSR